jgi:hypothetical protein
MNIAATVSKYLLALVFLVFGLNGFLNFIPQPPLPAGPMLQFTTAMNSTHYIQAVNAIEIAGAVLLLTPFVPLGLTFLAPVIVNIWIFHLTMMPNGIVPAVVVTVLWVLIYTRVRSAFAGITARAS